MSVEQITSVEGAQPDGTFPIASILSSQENTRAFFDDQNLSYIHRAYRVPPHDVPRARRIRDMLWSDPRALREYAQSILDEAYELNGLIYRAHNDLLTGLPKAEAWLANARVAISQCEASDGLEWAAVLFIDLSGFKRVNDVGGHEAGNDLLAQTGRELQERTRQEDRAACLGRMGGDEFAVLLRFSESRVREQMSREERTVRAAERIAGLLDAMFVEALDAMSAKDPRLKKLSVTAVTGYATWRPGMTAEQVLKMADDAMGVAKRKRKKAELQASSPEKQAALEQALGILREAGLEVDERDGVVRLV